MDYIQVSAKTVEDAVLEAAMKLATTREHLEYEVIEKGSTGFLGFGAKPAVIKARALSDEEIAKAEVKPEPVKEPVKQEVKKAAIAVRDWTFNNTSFNVIYSYMKHTNEPSYKTAISYGCKQVGEYKDDANEITKVFAITREEWDNR